SASGGKEASAGWPGPESPGRSDSRHQVPLNYGTLVPAETRWVVISGAAVRAGTILDRRGAAMPGMPRLAVPVITTWIVLNALTMVPAEAAIRLLRWEGPAELAASHAPGVPYYRLRCAVRADRGDLPQTSYLIQVVLPNGQTETHTIPEGEFGSRRID